MNMVVQQQQRKHSELREQQRPRIEFIHDFHNISDAVDDSIADMEMHKTLLTDEQIARVRRMIVSVDNLPALTVTEVDRQYHLFLRMQEQIASMDGELRATASIRDIAAVISSMSSLIGLFLKAQKELDSIKAEADLKDAVLSALKVIPADAQAKFFRRMEELEGS